MKPRSPDRQETAAAVHVRPLVGLLLACALGGAVAEPVVNPALAPVDMSKFLQQAPGLGMGQESGSLILGRREVNLKPGTSFAANVSPNWNGALEAVSSEGEMDLKSPRPAPLAGSKQGRDSNTPSLKGSSAQAPQQDFDLLRDALRELHDTSEVKELKEIWRDASAEMLQFRGGFLFDAPTEEELAQRRNVRLREESTLGGGSSFGFSNAGGGNEASVRPRTAAEQERDSILASIMLKKLIEDVTPWVIGLILSLGLLRAGLSVWRMQARRALRGQRAGASRSSSRRLRPSRRQVG